jgi:hypothetical protein
MKNDLTIVTLSINPFNRTLPDGLHYINYMSKFDNDIGLKKATQNSLERVKTKYVFFCDHDDPMPDNFPRLTKTVTFGDFHYRENNISKAITPNKLELGKEFSFIDVPHKPVVETEAYRQMVSHLPDIELCFHMAVYYLLCLKHETEYDKDFVAIWDKRYEGLHRNSFRHRNFTKQWLLDNARTIINMKDTTVKGK